MLCLLFTSRQSLCCPRRRDANETLDWAFPSLVKHDMHETSPLKKSISTLSERLQTFRKRVEEENYKTAMLVMQDQIIQRKQGMGAVYQNV